MRLQVEITCYQGRKNILREGSQISMMQILGEIEKGEYGERENKRDIRSRGKVSGELKEDGKN